MPGIWGCVDFSDTIIEDNIKVKMEEPFHKFKIDAFYKVDCKNAAMGYAHQNIKTWSKNEHMPHHDTENNMLFVADCVIDNRSELIAELCPKTADIADGTLLYLAYQKWGAEMGKKVYGAYSYALWDIENKQLTLGVDHTACRALYHRRVGNRIYFSTRMESILAVTEKKLNEKWLSLFLALRVLVILTDCETTPFVDVFRMHSAHYNVFTSDKTTPTRYYNFTKTKKLRYKTDEEYKEHFRKLFWKCVTEIIDGVDGKTGIMISGGFDSSTIGAQAAIKLAEEGKNLYGYTHVPVDGYVQKSNKKYCISDETQSVEKLCKMYPNLIPTFLKSPEADGFSNIREIQEIYETPYKSMTNIDWIHALYKQAGEDNCKMLLTGQCGNGTISYGRNEEFYLYEKLRTGRLIAAFSMANRLCKTHKISRKAYLKYYLKEYYGNYFKRNEKLDCLDNVFLNAEKAKELGITNNDERLYLNGSKLPFQYMEFHARRRLILQEEIFAHTSDYDTAFSLKNGMVLRDPARDVRILEFCNAVPMECFVNGVPQTKRLVRYYCADLLPAEFLPENAPRGMQSSDWYERISPKWNDLYPKVKHMLTTSAVKQFLNWDKVAPLIDLYEKVPEDDLYGYDFRDFAMLYGVGIFLERHHF